MSDYQGQAVMPSGYQPQGVGSMPIPRGGSFASSEVMPMIVVARDRMNEAAAEWKRLRVEADNAKALAKKTRADLMVKLRVWGNPETGNSPIKTAVERNEWADADPEVQRTELAADLAQTIQMTAREAYNDAQAQFDVMRSALAMERDDNRAERGGPS